MGFDYTKLWIILAQRNIKKTEMAEICGIASNTLAKLSKNQKMNMDTLAKLCKGLHVNVGDIVDYVEDEKDAGKP